MLIESEDFCGAAVYRYRRQALCGDVGLQGDGIVVSSVRHCNGVQRYSIHSVHGATTVLRRHRSQLVPGRRAVLGAAPSRL